MVDTRVARRINNGLANSQTPLVRNTWYVAALSEDLRERPIERKILERSVVIYRTAEGRVHALQNRCAHRSFPLADGQIIGDRLVCGYHGLQYDTDGKCVYAPSQGTEPKNLRVRSYPVVEIGKFVWIWMGEVDLMVGTLPPVFEWMSSNEWTRSFIEYHVPGSYIHLHENLLDLSHLSFLHIGSGFGTVEHAITPAEITVDGEKIAVWRDVQCKFPPMLGGPLGWSGHYGVRRSGTEWITPGLVTNTVELTNLEHPELNPSQKPTGKIGHFITPESCDRLHYYITFNRNYATEDSAATDFIRAGQAAALDEDLYALRRILEVARQDMDPSYAEKDIATDRAGLAMKKILKAMSDCEDQCRDQARKSMNPGLPQS